MKRFPITEPPKTAKALFVYYVNVEATFRGGILAFGCSEDTGIDFILKLNRVYVLFETRSLRLDFLTFSFSSWNPLIYFPVVVRNSRNLWICLYVDNTFAIFIYSKISRAGYTSRTSRVGIIWSAILVESDLAAAEDIVDMPLLTFGIY